MRTRTAVLAAAVVFVAGCSIGDIRRPQPTAAPPSPPGRPAPAEPAEVRQVRVPVPHDFDRSIVEFTDVAHGYAQFTRCGNPDATPAPDCEAILLATADGGRSWQPLRHPQPLAKNHQLYASADDLVLLAEPHGWYLSRDRGVTFRHEPVRAESPAAVRALGGRFQLCCDGDDPPKVIEWMGDRPRPVPVQPPVPGLASVAFDDGPIVAAGMRDGRVSAATSPDRGRRWWPVPVSAPDGALSALRLSVGRGDVWLIGSDGEDRTRFPQLWRCRGQSFERIDVAGHPARFTSVVPLGAGMLAVTGPNGPGVVTAGDNGGRYNHANWPVRDAYLQLLPDGTLFAEGSDGSETTAWLGPGVFGERRWIKLVLERT